MKILSMAVLDDEAVTRLRRDAQRQRRERHKYLMSCHPSTLLQIEISAYKSQIYIFQDTKSVDSQIQPVANPLIRNYAEYDDVDLFRFAQEKGKPVLVEFSWQPSKAGEERLRQTAKTSNLKLSLFRLTGRWAIVEVHPRHTYDADVLKGLGVRW